MSAKRILYVQHAGAMGGSAMSLLYLVQGLDRARFEPVIALIRPTPELTDLYTRAGVQVIPWPGIPTFEHTTLLSTRLGRPTSWLPAIDLVRNWRRALPRTRELLAEVRPDLVHLNSAVLYPMARALAALQAPFVWHVREPPAKGLVGVRRRIIAHAMIALPREIFFLSEAEKEQWIEGAPGCVLPNFVDLQRFAPMDRKQARRELGLPEDAPIVLYVGGLAVVKGIFPLLKALAIVRGRRPDLLCLMPGAAAEASTRLLSRVGRVVIRAAGKRPLREQVERAISGLGLAGVCRREPFLADVRRHMGAADVLCFPSIDDHFARPVIEAAAMAVPSIGSRFPILKESILDGETGLLVTPGDHEALAAAIEMVLGDPAYGRRLGLRGRESALERYDAARGCALVMSRYDEILR
jgi:glycosyltransferase involved in cell wall biosynthesis